MTAKHLVVLAIILSYAGVFFIFRKRALSYFGGLEYLFIGVAISFVGVDTKGLIPLLYPFLGWIGLLFGLQLKFNYLQGLSVKFYKSTVVYTLLSALIIGGVLFLLGFKESATVTGIALSVISYKTVAHFFDGKDRKTREILFFVSFTPFIAFVLLFVFYFFNYSAGNIFYFISFTVLFGFISQAVFKIITDKDSVLLILIGFVILISETCAILGISPLVMGFLIGIFLSNFSKWKEFIFIALFQDEKPLYILFLLILGLTFGLAFQVQVLKLALTAILVVAAVKNLVVKTGDFPVSKIHSIYILSPGGLGVAIVTDYWLLSGATSKSVWFSACLLAIVVLQFLVAILGDKK